ncbi:MAG: hypothetical protein QXX12_05305 [Nanopusillaceae archaeon]
MLIKEGSAIIDIPEVFLSKKSAVFYNPLMKINRDFTIILLKSFYQIRKKRLDILDAMAASGIRSIRILKEIPDVVNNIKVVDIKKEAVENIKKNFLLNNLKDNYEILKEDCRIIMYKEKFDYIDIDPFGSPIGFIQPAVNSLKNFGLLGVTATDISALSASKPIAGLRKYGIIGYKTDFYLEFGIRVLAKYVIEEGIKFESALIPIFAYYYKHHYRIFFIKSKKSKDIKNLLENIKKIFYCNKCGYKSDTENICINCNKKMDELGPIYVGSLYEKRILDIFYNNCSILELDKSEKKILERIVNCDSKLNLWYYYDIRYLSKFLKIKQIPKISELIQINSGCRTHFSDYGIKCLNYPKIYID